MSEQKPVQPRPDEDMLADMSVAGAGARLLRDAASFFTTLAGDNPKLAQGFTDTAEACRLMAEQLSKGPFTDPIHLVDRPGLDGMMQAGTERRYSSAEVAAMLLRDTAKTMQALAEQSPDMGGDLIEAADTFVQTAALLENAPGAQLGAELDELDPYIEALSSRADLLFHPARATTARLLEHPPFLALAERLFALNVGGKFSRMGEAGRISWAGPVARIWLEREGPLPEPLTEDEQRQIVFAAERPRAGWAQPPIIAGDDWRDADPADAAALLILISEIARAGAANTPLAIQLSCDRVRTRPLACHGGVLLVEAQGYGAGGAPGLVQAVIHDRRIIVSDGLSAPIHALNGLVGPQLATPAARRDYFSLFLSWSRQPGGERFHPIETVEQLRAKLPGPVPEAALAAIAPVADLDRDPLGDWRMTAVMAFRNLLARGLFTISDRGEVNMIDEAILAEDLPLAQEIQVGWLVLPADPVPETAA